MRQSNRSSHPPSYLADYHNYPAINKSHALHSNAFNIAYPLSSVLTYDKCLPSYKHFCCAITYNTEPKSFTQPIKLDCWKNAMNVELQALAENHTWDVVELPSGKKPIGCRWVYKIKYRADGSIERYKARLVGKGYTNGGH